MSNSTNLMLDLITLPRNKVKILLRSWGVEILWLNPTNEFYNNFKLIFTCHSFKNSKFHISGTEYSLAYSLTSS